MFASVTVETREWLVTMETCINTACNDFHVESDIEEIWEGGCINGAGSKGGWSELCKKAGGCESKWTV